MIDNTKIYQVDSFTNTKFKGNPAGVMIVDKTFTESQMQDIAMEMNLSETAFVCPNNDFYDIRYFTPTREIALCGHATLASAHIMYQRGFVPSTESIIFQAMNERLTIGKEQDWITMEFPVYNLQEIPVLEKASELLDIEVTKMYSSDDGWIIAIGNDEAIKKAKPKFSGMEAAGLGHSMITGQSQNDGADFVVRCFAPQSGINEDPVTGSAHCALVPLWSPILNKIKMISHQVSERSGTLHLELKNEKLLIKGQAVTIFEAVLTGNHIK